MVRQAGAVVLVMLFGLASCTVGPDYVRPTAPMQETFKEMAGWKQAEPREDLLRGKWWEIFTNSELSALQDQVDITNQNIATAAANFRQAVALVAVARASYFPTASINPSATRLYRSTGTASASASAASAATAADVNVYSLPATASWVPDIWGLVRRNVESSRASAQASAGLLENVRLSAHAQVAQDYFQLRTLDAQKAILHETVEAYRKALQLTENKYNAGVSSKADVLQAETQLKTTMAQEIDVGVQRAQLEHAIALLTGRPPATFSIPFSPISVLPPPVPVGVPSVLLERRPDVATARGTWLRRTPRSASQSQPTTLR